MSSADITLLGQIAPEYISFSDTTRFNVLKGIAEGFVDETLFVGKVDYAVTLMIAHMLKIGERAGSGGSVESEKVDKLKREYTPTATKSDQELAATSYGQEYLRCRKSVIIKPIIWD